MKGTSSSLHSLHKGQEELCSGESCPIPLEAHDIIKRAEIDRKVVGAMAPPQPALLHGHAVGNKKHPIKVWHGSLCVPGSSRSYCACLKQMASQCSISNNMTLPWPLLCAGPTRLNWTLILSLSLPPFLTLTLQVITDTTQQVRDNSIKGLQIGYLAGKNNSIPVGKLCQRGLDTIRYKKVVV